jgi:hypothetical protein
MKASFELFASHMWPICSCKISCKCQTLPSCSHMQSRSCSLSALAVSGSFSSRVPGPIAVLCFALPSLPMLCAHSALLMPKTL